MGNRTNVYIDNHVKDGLIAVDLLPVKENWRNKYRLSLKLFYPSRSFAKLMHSNLCLKLDRA